MNHPIQALRFPVTQTGTYYNDTLSRYEFWFFLNGQTALCGAAQKDLPDEVIRAWRSETLAGLQARVLAKIATGELKVNPLQGVRAGAGV
jgi:hypothetical protein